MQCYCPLTIPLPLFASGVSRSDFSTAKIALVDKKLINPQIFDLFEQLDLHIMFMESFYRNPAIDTPIHTDARGGDYTKLIWIFGCGQSSMAWYRPKTDYRGYLNRTAVGTEFLSFRPDKVEFIQSARLLQPTLVQVGVPHNVLNITEPRLTVTIIFWSRPLARRPTMAESRQIFKNYIAY